MTERFLLPQDGSSLPGEILFCTAPPAEKPRTELMSTMRLAQLSRMRHEDARCLAIAAELLLAEAYAAYRGLPLSPVEWAVGSHGKPFLPADPDFHFNLSHTRGMAAIAAGPVSVGLDIEQRTDRGDAVARRVMSNGEYMLYQTSLERDAAFTELWTLKEAYAKLTGLGFALPFSSINVENNTVAAPGQRAAMLLRPQAGGSVIAAICLYV